MWKIFILVGMFCFSLLAEETQKQESMDPLFYGACDTPNFIMRWHYQFFCDYVYDPRTDIWRWPTDEERGVTFNPQNVKAGDTIFIRMFPKFFEEMHPKITNPYIIVSAGECLDKMIDEYKHYLDEEKVIAWFGIHPNEMAMDHPKFHPIPIGILQDPYYYKQRKKLNGDFLRLRTTIKKEYLVYMNFAYEGKPERKRLRSRFLHEPYCKHGERQEFKDYLKQMAQSCFTLSPEGLGPDCYRTWEALLVGSIPVVKRSCMDSLYDGLPVLIVDSWDEVTEAYLKESYKKITAKKYDISRLYADFWTNKIRRVQLQFLKGRQ
jgi:hypothetical protein